MTSEPVERFLARLEGVRADGSGWSARCPCRQDDENPSLHVGEGHDGRVLVTCHRGGGCDLGEICSAMGLSVNDLFAGDRDGHRSETRRPKSKPPARPAKPRQRLTLVATYDYTDADGRLLFQKQRFVDEDGVKTFRQRKPRPDGGWEYALGDTPKVLYRLPEVAAAVAEGRPVLVVEGEKDADTLAGLGYVATTMPGGAGKWRDVHSAAVAGARVWVIRDNDDAGIAHAVEVHDAVAAAGGSVTLLAPPAEFKDVTDFVEAGGTVEELRPWDPEHPDLEPPDPLVGLAGEIAALAEKPLDLAKKLVRVRGLVDRLDPAVADPIEPGRLVEWVPFIAETVDESYDWVIPGVLERQDRVIVVAAEGVGKTMLARQMAIASAFGIHPFTYERMPPIRTLTIDLENPERIIRRMSTKVVRTSMRLSGLDVPPKGLDLLIRPAGMDLLGPADRILLEEAIERTRPELVCLGPLYKSFVDGGTRTSEALAVDLAKYLDYLRTTYDFALWIEHHAPLGNSGGRDLRPFGSAVWSRWPEFGWTLEPDLTAEEAHVYKWGRFRNDREPRHRPTKVRRGKVYPFEVIEFLKVD